MNDPGYLPLWLSATDLARVLGVSQRTIRRYHAEGRIPPPHHFTLRTLRWHRDDIFPLLDRGPGPAGFYLPKPKNPLPKPKNYRPKKRR